MPPKGSTKTKPSVPGGAAKPATPRAGHNSGKELTADERQTLFLRDKDAYIRDLAAQKKATKAFQDTCKRIKADGFTNKQIKAAIEMDTPEGEARVRAEVLDILQAAKWVGSHQMGNQLDMFQEPDRTPSVDKAYDEGKRTSMENKPAAPVYAPETEQYRHYMQGYHDHQRELAGGLKAPEQQPSE